MAWVKLSFCTAKKKVWQRKSRNTAGRASAARPPDCLSLLRKKTRFAQTVFFRIHPYPYVSPGFAPTSGARSAQPKGAFSLFQAVCRSFGRLPFSGNTAAMQLLGLLLKGGVLLDILRAAVDNVKARFVTIFAGW
jgi:hypothetical protein